MDAIQLTHVPLAEVKPGSLLLVGPDETDSEQYFAIAHDGVGEPYAARLVSFRADRDHQRALPTQRSPQQTPLRCLQALGRHYAREPNLHEQARTDYPELSAHKPGDVLVHGAQPLLVVEPATAARPLVADLATGEVIELAATSVAVVTHWNINVRSADGRIICLVDTKSHKQASAY